MSEAPKRIWCKPKFDSWGAYGHWYQDAKGGGTEYIRADIHADLTSPVGWQDIESAVMAERERIVKLAHELCHYSGEVEIHSLDAAIRAATTQGEKG